MASKKGTRKNKVTRAPAGMSGRRAKGAIVRNHTSFGGSTKRNFASGIVGQRDPDVTGSIKSNSRQRSTDTRRNAITGSKANTSAVTNQAKASVKRNKRILKRGKK